MNKTQILEDFKNNVVNKDDSFLMKIPGEYLSLNKFFFLQGKVGNGKFIYCTFLYEHESYDGDYFFAAPGKESFLAAVVANNTVYLTESIFKTKVCDTPTSSADTKQNPLPKDIKLLDAYERNKRSSIRKELKAFYDNLPTRELTEEEILDCEERMEKGTLWFEIRKPRLRTGLISRGEIIADLCGLDKLSTILSDKLFYQHEEWITKKSIAEYVSKMK